MITLFLTFRAGTNRYALEARRVIEVVPWVALRPIPGAPDTIPGFLNYRGMCVPVVDLCLLLGGTRCRQRLSARLILTSIRSSDRRERVVGLLAERVTETISREETDFTQPGLCAGPAAQHGLLAPAANGFVQRIQPEVLLAGGLQSVLLGPAPQSR
jgi:chemotaxis-related protein WspB